MAGPSTGMAPITWACPVIVQSGPVTWAQIIFSWRQSLGLVQWLGARAQLDSARASASRSPEDKIRSYPPIRDSNSNSNSRLSDDRDKARDFYLKESLACLAGHPKQEYPTAIQRKVAENSPKIREKRKKNREKSSLEARFPIQPRCAHVLRIAAVLNQP